MSVAGVAVAVVFLVLSNLTVEQSPVSVAVLDFENRTEEPDLGNLVADLLVTDLAQSPNVRVLYRERLRELKGRRGTDAGDLTSNLELARLAGVQALVSGRVVQVGGVLRIDASVYDVASGELMFAGRSQGRGTDAVFDMVDEISKDIRKRMKVIPRWGPRGEPPLAEITTGSVEAYRLYLRGEEIRFADPSAAVAFMEQAVSVDTAFVEAYRELAVLYNDYIGDYDSALANALKAKELSKGRGEKEYLKSLMYESWIQADWDGVITYMKDYLELQPNDFRIQRRLGWVLYRRKMAYEEAIVQLQKVIAMDSKNLSGELGPAYNNLGHAYLFSGRHEEALGALRDYERLEPGKVDPLHSIADAYRLSGRYDMAVQQYQRVIGDAPGYFLAYEGLGLTYEALGKWREALGAFRRLIAATPWTLLAEAHMRMAFVYWQQGDLALATEHVSEATACDAERVEAHWLRGVIALKQQQSTNEAREALDALARVVEPPPRSDELCLLYNLEGRILLAEGETGRGLEALRRAAEVCPDEGGLFQRDLAAGYLEAGDPQRALDAVSRIAKLNASDARALAIAAVACARLGDEGGSRKYADRALDVWKGVDADYGPLRELEAFLSK